MTLAYGCYLLGGPMALAGLWLVAAGGARAAALGRFARHVWAGRLLATIAWIWGAHALYTMPLDFILPYRHYIPFSLLLLIPLSWFWMEDLLGCRAIGGLLTLFPTPLLKLTDLHPSPWRLAPVILAYLAIVAGMVLLLYPYHLRRLLDRLATQPPWRRTFGIFLLSIGLLLIILGATSLKTP